MTTPLKLLVCTTVVCLNLTPTPTIDRIANEGILFENAFCTNAICTPSKTTIITGQYSQANGVLDLNGKIPAERQYLAHEMKKAGYTTAIVGKWHLEAAPDAFDYFSVLPGQGKYHDPVLYSRDEGIEQLSKITKQPKGNC